ncbi:MAG TPA: alanine--glyoxylate aminotransferase family protein [Syntrophomonadaceae bacterium]|nr:alanine--glyoxylate aminotransferase family protein [Syntrophomonadaceae bacterium]
MRKKLFIPGPVEVRADVLEKMSQPMIGHRSKDASDLQRQISDKIRQLLYTEEEVLLSTSSGSGLMEGAIRTCTAKRAAVFSIGAFGKRWYEMAIANNVPADIYETPMGLALSANEIDKILATGKYDLLTVTHNETSTGVMNPLDELAPVIAKYEDIIWCVDAVSSVGGSKIEVDKLGIDICITSTQKALGLPPGMAICTFSKKAINRAEKVPYRGFYLDLLALYKYVRKRNYQYPSTPSLSHMFALNYQLDLILAEGLDKRFDRHVQMAEYVRDWARVKFALFADEGCLSNTLTAIKNTRNIDVANLNKELGVRGFQISNGYGSLKDKTFRIAHMADCSLGEIEELISTINDILSI